MPKPLYELCWDIHDATGTIGYPTPDVIRTDPSAKHMSVRTCGRTACLASANRAIRRATGHDGTFRPFPRHTSEARRA